MADEDKRDASGGESRPRSITPVRKANPSAGRSFAKPLTKNGPIVDISGPGGADADLSAHRSGAAKVVDATTAKGRDLARRNDVTKVADVDTKQGREAARADKSVQKVSGLTSSKSAATSAPGKALGKAMGSSTTGAAAKGKATAAKKAAKDPVGAAADKALKGVSKKSETAGAVLKGAAQGASKAGLAGAALGAVKGLAKTKKGRIILIGALAIPAAAPLAYLTVLALLVGLLTGGASNSNSASTAAGQVAGLTNTTLNTYYEAQSETGTPWQVIAAVQWEESGGHPASTPADDGSGQSANPPAPPTTPAALTDSSADAFLGPFHISQRALNADHVDVMNAQTLSGAAAYIGRKFAAALATDTTFDPASTPIDSGRVDNADSPSTIDPDDSGGKQVAIAYPKAIAAIPVEGMTAAYAAMTFKLALAWALGNQSTDEGGNGGVVCSTSVPDTTLVDTSTTVTPTPTTGIPPVGLPTVTPTPTTGIPPVGLPTVTPTPTASATTSPTPTPTSLTVTDDHDQPMVLDAQQLTNAADIIGVGTQMGVTQNGLTAAIMTGLQESKLLILANTTIPESETNPHKQGDGNNLDSVGIFQQRDSWGSVTERMTAATSAQLFYKALLAVPGWQMKPAGDLSQAVQKSNFPDAYAAWLSAATTVLGAVTGVSCTDAGGTAVGGDAKTEAAALVALWKAGKITGNPQPLADLEATVSGAGWNTAAGSDPSCGGHHVAGVDVDLMYWLLVGATKFKMELWNISTGHDCDAFYHPPGMASDIGSVTELATGKTTNFYPGTAGNDPTTVTHFIDFMAASGPDHEEMGQGQCADDAGGGPKFQSVTFDTDVCTHQHLNVHQGDPQWGPYTAETWPSGNGPTTGSSGGSATGAAATAIAYAQKQVGIPYVFGAAGPAGFDCSGLTMAAYAAAGIALPHSSETQYTMGTAVTQAQLQPGDLVFFNGAAPGHVGVYIGGGQMIDAPHTGADVRIEPVAGFGGYVGARRLTATV